MNWLKRIIDLSSKALGAIGNTALMVMMVIMVADIALRYLLNIPLMGSYEIVEFLMVIVVFFQLAQTEQEDGHIRVTMLVDRFPKKVRQSLNVLLLLLSSAIMGLAGYAAVIQTFVVKGKNLTSAVLFIPVYPFVFLLAIGSFMFMLTLLLKSIMACIEMFEKGEVCCCNEEMNSN